MVQRIVYRHHSLHNQYSKRSAKEIWLFLALFITAIIISGYELKLLKTYQLIDRISEMSIDYNAFRKLQISEEAVEQANIKLEHLLTKEPKYSTLKFIDEIGYLTYSMMARDYDLSEHTVVDKQTFLRGIGRVATTDTFQELYQYYSQILSDLQYFPVPEMEAAQVNYSNTWNELRTYGGNRSHEGTDLMDSNNLRGYFPIISVTDGTVEKMGWLEQGGYRIGIRASSGGYFYYAHLYSYAPELEVGDTVIAGELLGFMGDSGYGSEGTIGQFDVHLHLGIYVNSKVGEMSVNPYWILKILEKNRTKYD